MPEPRVMVLDVGHGCCTVLHDDDGAIVFDYPGGAVPRDYFRTVGVREIDATFISHTHRDHCEGLTGHFGDALPIAVIFMNRQRGPRRTRLYKQVIKAIGVAKKGPTPPRLVPFNSDIREPCLDRGPVRIRILAPDSELGYEDSVSEWENEHTSCGVVRIDYREQQSVLLPGDLDLRGLEALVEQDPGALKARVLVFPHHGGTAGGDTAGFAERLTSLVAPEFVVFSQARGEEERPRPEVVEGVRRAAPDAHISCTQLSRGCDKRDLHESALRSEIALPAAGTASAKGACCAGPMEILFAEKGVKFVGQAAHKDFVGTEVARPLCVPGAPDELSAR